MTDEKPHKQITEPMQKQVEFSLELGRTSAIYAEEMFTVYISLKNISNENLRIWDFGVLKSVEFDFYKRKPHPKPSYIEKLSKFISNLKKSEEEKIEEKEKRKEKEKKTEKEIILSPGETYTYCFFGTTVDSLWFRPDKYKFMLWVDYSNGKGQDIKESKVVEIDVLAPIKSIIIGAAVGGFVGGAVRILSKPPYDYRTLIELIGTIILSMFAVIVLARKTGTQTLITVQDIYGGILVGFLVGYSGKTFFDQFIGITSTSSSSPTNVTATNLQYLVSPDM